MKTKAILPDGWNHQQKKLDGEIHLDDCKEDESSG